MAIANAFFTSLRSPISDADSGVKFTASEVHSSAVVHAFSSSGTATSRRRMPKPKGKDWQKKKGKAVAAPSAMKPKGGVKKRKVNPTKDVCLNCNKKGYWKKYCTAPGGGKAPGASTSGGQGAN